jgi:two-component system alkaline phosphatase synthesis response regulator PhoP
MAKKPRILLVDDDVDFIDLNKAVLENNGFDVVTAFSGREATDKVSFERPDLIVLDLMLEKHDTGFAFAKALKANPLHQKIPILMLTAVAGETGYDFSQELDGYWMKTDDYASKPLLPEELIKRVTMLLAKAKEEG